MVELIVNPKSLEKQIKLLEQKILELQSEVQELEKRREACHILLGTTVRPLISSAETVELAPKKSETKRSKRSSEILKGEDFSPDFIEIVDPQEASASEPIRLDS